MHADPHIIRLHSVQDQNEKPLPSKNLLQTIHLLHADSEHTLISTRSFLISETPRTIIVAQHGTFCDRTVVQWSTTDMAPPT